MKTALITGGTGFLGSNLCIRLMRDGWRVICVDNNYTGSLENVAELDGNPDFRFIRHDITEPLGLDGAVDRIYNLACPASPAHYQGSHALETTRACVLGSLNMLELARRKDARILQTSTSEVYGEPQVSPQPESYRGNVSPIGIRACYDEGKRCAESVFFDHARIYGTEIKVVRIFNTYGPKMRIDDGRVVSNFIVQALLGRDITIYGDGQQTRSFCFVDDMMEGMIRMMESPADFAGPVNLGNPGEFTMVGLAEKIMHKTKSESSIIFMPLPDDDPHNRRPDIELAEKRLGWAPKVALDEGLARTIGYFRHKLGFVQ